MKIGGVIAIGGGGGRIGATAMRAIGAVTVSSTTLVHSRRRRLIGEQVEFGCRAPDVGVESGVLA